METLNSIGGEFWIQNNEQLTDISSLSALQEVGENMGIIYNPLLNSLEGLNNINPESIFNLSIHNNPLLTHCAIASICDYLLNPAGEVQIHDNALGCNSQTEVEDACWTTVDEIAYDDKITISPNPLNSTTLIQYTLPQNSPVTLIILDLSGREIITLVNEVQQQGEQRIEFNTSGMQAGVYTCVLKTNNGIKITKMIKL